MNSWKPQKPPFANFKKSVFRKAAKTSGLIFQIGEYPELRKRSKEVDLKTINSQQTQKKFHHVKSSLVKYRKLTGYGRGITAIQVGISERFSAVLFDNQILFIINPKVMNKSKKKLLYPEMCMSAVPIVAPTIRPSWIEFEYYDEKGNIRYWKTKDDTKKGKILNRVIQHEIDHMDGIINVDLVKNPRDLILESDPNFYKNAEFKEV